MKFVWFTLVIGLQCAWLLSTVAIQEHQLAHAETILLDTRSVDPRDYLRGDYVILNYSINRLRQFMLNVSDATNVTPGQTLYVLLEKKQRFHEPVSVSLNPPTPNPGQVFLRGTVQSSWSSVGGNPEMWVNYGLERYYVAEGTGNPTAKLTVEVAVAKNGRALIKQVYLNDLPYRKAMQKP